LVSLGLIPLIVAIYIWILRRRCRFAVRYSSLSLFHEALFPLSLLRRHLPFSLFLVALVSLTLALGRPITPEAVLSGQTTIMLTLDVSRSMCMQDITPNRLEVARATALSFVQQPVLGTQVGVVAFAGFAELAQKPTTNLQLLESTITNLTTATETAISSAILEALDAIADVDDRVRPSDKIDGLTDLSSKQVLAAKSLKREYVPHIIVLLTDGASNTGHLLWWWPYRPRSAACGSMPSGLALPMPRSWIAGTASPTILPVWKTRPAVEALGMDPMKRPSNRSRS
jgi:Ca-activated chloride channel family protein